MLAFVFDLLNIQLELKLSVPVFLSALLSWSSAKYPSLMMRLTHNTSYISLSALEQQPCGSSATIFPPVSSPQHRQRRPVVPLEDQLLENMQNVTVNDYDFISLGITPVNMNPWQPNSMSFGTASTNGFTGSDTSSAPMSPISSPGPRKNYGTHGNGYHQQTQKSFYKSPTHPNHFRNNRNVNGGTSQQNGFHNGQHYQNRNGFNGNNVQHTVAPTVRTLRNTEDYKPGMRDLGYWLKKLRLHKYAPLFEDMTYRQLLNVNDEVLEKMRVTNGARKKISQSIEKLHERPELLRSLEQKMKNGSQCVRCAICSIRQLLWSPFIKYDGGNRKTSADIIDGFNVPSQMISDDNIPALVFRCIETLNNMVFPLRKGLQDLEDEYQLTMFHMFESVMKNEAFTPNQQRRAYIMKKNARNYANPEEIRRHRMGMVSSSQCEGCHHAEVVNRERLMELQDRQARQARGDPVGLSLTSCTAILDLRSSNMNGRLEYNVPPAPVPTQRIQKRPAFSGDIEDEWDGSPKITAPSSSPPDSVIFESLVLPQMKSSHFWSNVENIWGDDGNKPSTSFRFPLYRRPEEMDESSNTESPVNNEDAFTFLEMVSEKQPSKDISLSDFAFPEASSKKANSTGSGCSSSESEVSIVTSPCASMTGTEDEPILYGVNQILYPSSPFE
ncbi:hypothetical protein GCK72_018900 [Caenorhabditis remanei]|uniref:SAM domain-containing protein n=1 Tax=Caenorhabditis remanei TaxID=31234 RepID=A0A6A5GBV7_CAERE|nr:hypothetical protein GCK72_018900 [Caenorhabditis remanei]KAF1752346.1 hypothetical protein GCK72_018900 [Caenorhabditis remanei]